MISYRDKTFCSSAVHYDDCRRQVTDAVKAGAREWWGGDDYPLATADFCGQRRRRDIDRQYADDAGL